MLPDQLCSEKSFPLQNVGLYKMAYDAYVYMPAKPENNEILKFCQNFTILGELQEFLRFAKQLREFGGRM